MLIASGLIRAFSHAATTGRARALRKSGEDLLWVRKDGKDYVVRDVHGFAHRAAYRSHCFIGIAVGGDAVQRFCGRRDQYLEGRVSPGDHLPRAIREDARIFAVLRLVDGTHVAAAQTAMTGIPARGRQHLASNGSPQLNSRTQTGGSHRRVAHPTQRGGGGSRCRDWNQDPPTMAQTSRFQTAYREARRAAFGQAVARLQQGASAAATTLLKTMIDPNTPASVRVRAAECVMNHATKAIEIEDIEARVAMLEESAANAQRR